MKHSVKKSLKKDNLRQKTFQGVQGVTDCIYTQRCEKSFHEVVQLILILKN